MTEGSEETWNSYSELTKVLNQYLLMGAKDKPIIELETVLRKYKQNFFTLLQNPPKNSKCRKDLEKGMVDGITVRGIGHQVLSKELYQETIIISDMYDMNEYMALDLLCTAQLQMSFYPGLPRGLVAVLLYYTARKTLAYALRLLINARSGVLWRTADMRDDVEKLITDYTNELLKNGIIIRLLDLLKSLDLSKEIDKLQQNAALGGPKHRRQVIDLFNEIRLLLAETVFLWSANCGLVKDCTVALIGYLREAKLDEEASGKLSNVNMYLLMGLLYTMDLSVLRTREDGEDIVQSLPIISEPNYVDTLMNELAFSHSNWKCDGLKSVVLFGFGVCLACLRDLPQSQQQSIDQEEDIIEKAIEMKVFDFLNSTILDNELITSEEYVVRRLHNLLTDFICAKYSKVKELRVQADETARTIQVYMNEGLEPPANLPRHFEQFLLVISKLYENNPLDLNLAINYWSPLEIKSNQTTFHLLPSKSAHSLFKFIRLAGDLLPATLFVPYLKMLGSLAATNQSARYCFNMLKSAPTAGAISWDHFFLTFNRYYSSLHQETPSAVGTVYGRQNLFHKGITPLEIEGLQAVLYVIRKVADNDDFSRLALCEHPGWAPLNVLLGLVSCSVPIPLKADLLLTLASLAKSPEIATQLWENLEASQILVTVPSTSSYQPRGIETELNEIESHVEEYPLTRAFLLLLDVLTDAGIPRTLGAGPRIPGFDPYLHFIVSSVFLKFLSRTYKNQEEKWQIASICLKLLEKFLLRYEPNISDFPVDDKIASFNSPPGYHLMLQLNTKSDLLNLLIFIVDEGCRLFSQYVPFVGRKWLEECTLRCLNLFKRGLILQGKFISVSSTIAAPKLLTGLAKLLLTINPRSGKPDCCVTIAKYTGFQQSLPQHVLAAVKLLIHITESPILHSQFTSILFVSDDVTLIKNNFVECLEVSLSHPDCDLYVETKEKILQLLEQCLTYTAPNLTHFLLGFDLNRDISKMQFQYPGVLQFPRNCLHSLLGILKSTFIPLTTTSTLLESAYRLLYLLVSDGKTSEPILKLLRMDQKFFREHLEFCTAKMNQCITDLNQLSWLLQTIAVEVKVTCSQNQIFYLKQLTNLLVDMPPVEIDRKADIFDFAPPPPSTSVSYEDENLYIYSRDKVDNLLIRLILCFDFNVTPIEEPRYDYFDVKALEGILEQCELDEKPKLIDVKKLHQILIEELNNLQGNVAVGQRQAILEEIQKVLVYAVSLNEMKKTRHSMVCFVNGWSELVEVLVSCLPIETLSLKEQQIVDLQLLDALLNKALKMEMLPDIAVILSATAMTLLANLRYSYKRELKCLQTKTPTVIEANEKLIKGILKNLIQWLMQTGVADQMIRAHLYAALIYILHLVSLKTLIKKECLSFETATFVSRLDNSKITENTSKHLMNTIYDVLSQFGEKFLETIAQDCVGSHNVCKLLAMYVFGLLVEVNGMINWIVFVSSKGYLRHIMESVFKSDDDLITLLDPSSETDTKSLFIYESRMALLTRIASTRVGAELLLEQKLLSYLTNMKIFNHHPEIRSDYGEEDIESLTIPTSVKYIRVWLPTFYICNNILTSLGTDNQSAVVQITNYILNQLNTIEMVLRAGNPTLSKWSLKELTAVTSVIARTAHNDLLGVLDNETESQNIRRLLFRIQKLMLSLLPKFILNNTVVKEALKGSENSFKTTKRLLLIMKITSNLLLYCRNIIANNGIDHSAVGVIFQPSLKDSSKFVDYSTQHPSLGVILEHLIHTVRYQQQERHTFNYLKKYYNEVPKMNSAELKECLKEVEDISNIRLAREHAMLVFTEKLKSKQQEMEHCAFAIEHCLYIVWTHLDYFMLKAIPKARNLGLLNLSQTINLDTTLASASEATWKVTTDDISTLKQSLVSIFNDSFCKQLIDTAEDRSDADKQLLETLLRKIKRLVQFAPVK